MGGTCLPPVATPQDQLLGLTACPTGLSVFAAFWLCLLTCLFFPSCRNLSLVVKMGVNKLWQVRARLLTYYLSQN